MSLSFVELLAYRHRLAERRLDFDVPDLVGLQRASFDAFLQADCPPNERKDTGLHAALKGVFPIMHPGDLCRMDYISYRVARSRMSADEARRKNLTYEADLYLLLRLTVFEIDSVSKQSSVVDIREQEVYVGAIPIMTDNGSFIVNSVERVVISQLHRSAGVFFGFDESRVRSSDRSLAVCRVVPRRGSWLDFEFDPYDVIHFRIDRRRKLPVTALFYALGFSQEEVIGLFYNTVKYERVDNDYWMCSPSKKGLADSRLSFDLLNPDTKKILVASGTVVTPYVLEDVLSAHEVVYVHSQDLVGQCVGKDVVLPNGSVIVNVGQSLDKDALATMQAHGRSSLHIVQVDVLKGGNCILATMAADKTTNKIEAMVDIYRIVQSGDAMGKAELERVFNDLFFNPLKYDLSEVGRLKLNMNLGLDVPEDCHILTNKDFTAIIKYLIALQYGDAEPDDIDHLGNRRVRTVGELLENQVISGLTRVVKATRDQMSTASLVGAVPKDLIAARFIVSAIRDFFSSSELSQFMDQTNPLSELAHKRRLSALGQGGLNRDRAGFEVRDVHPTHYGRICPIETPEGPNIGLVAYMAFFTRINKYGFLEAPYRRVVEGRVQSNEVVYLNAWDEQRYKISSSTPLGEDGKILDDVVPCRYKGGYHMIPSIQVQFTDLSPLQIISISASLIPHLSCTDGNRALMGSNMARQALPLIKPQLPLVGTGMESVVARDSGANVRVKRAGMVRYVDSRRIAIDVDMSDGACTGEGGSNKVDIGVDMYHLQKFARTNSGTCMNQRPIVRVGDKVKCGDIVADGYCMDRGQLALGSNVCVLFASMKGYNFEDAIVISERLVRESVYSSVHIHEFSISIRDTRLGPEEITGSVPNCPRHLLRHLDETGIVHVGAIVEEGEVLVGRVTPKGGSNDQTFNPQERFLRTIFRQRVSEVKDTSLKVPPGVRGTIVDVAILNRHGLAKDDRSNLLERTEIMELNNDIKERIAIYDQHTLQRLQGLLAGASLKDGTELSRDDFENKKLSDCVKHGCALADDGLQKLVDDLFAEYYKVINDLERERQERFVKIQSGVHLMPGVMKVVNVYVAVKRDLRPGDKISGRHGNKGVVSVVLPDRDMPYLADGRVVDMVLNPLGVPSRMNVGQIMELALGFAAKRIGERVSLILSARKHAVDNGEDGLKYLEQIRALLSVVYSPKEYSEISALDKEGFLRFAAHLHGGVPMAVPAFEEGDAASIDRLLKIADLPASGQMAVYDGQTGEKLERFASVGYMYIMKLNHLVDDKKHARATGPYSLVTRQPLGGKANFGAFRAGEMEIWAIEGYGAAYMRQEMTTVKSDAVLGRNKMFASIVEGRPTMYAHVPEAFNVLVEEIRALGVDLRLEKEAKEVESVQEDGFRAKGRRRRD